ncbi:SET domain-containing protein [Aureococcus anophagefferens]|nr:SET domain-containing protein [Aureococcus anophagefferens]
MDFVTSEDRVQGLVDLVARWSIVQRRRVAGKAAGVVAGREAARAAKMVADLNAEELERACGCDDLLVKCAVYPLLCPVLERLLEKGAKANGARRGGLSLLHVAAIWDNDRAMRALLKKQADVAAVDELRRTPLHLAAHYGGVAAAKLLLDFDASADGAEAPAVDECDAGDLPEEDLMEEFAAVFDAREGPRLKRLKRNRAAAELETCGAPEPWTCPGCGNRTTDAPAAHPDFDAVRVPVCWECRWMRDQGTFDVGDDGNEEFCRLCGEGGDLLLCDTDGCSRSHCAGCVARVTGRGVAAAESSVWHCFQCDRASLEEARVAHQWDAIFEAYEARLSKRARAMARKAWTLVGDLSNGDEARAVPCVGRAERAPPVKVFEYAAAPVVPPGGAVKPVENAGCDCVGSCGPRCPCVCRGGEANAYGADGTLTNQRIGNFVFECHDDCNCRAAACRNRVVGAGLKLPLEVFHTGTDKGWGVRCRDKITKGTFVAAYGGEILTQDEAEERGRKRGAEYFLDCAAPPPQPRAAAVVCVPNMRGATVYVESDMPRLAFFALKDIRKGTELTWDYKRTQNETDGVPCLCGYANCREGLL